MAHEIETMAYFGERPWHGLGTALAEDDLYDWRKTCEKAGLDWEVELVPLVTDDTHAKVAHKAVRRSTDGRVLGVVGPRYFPLQNKDAFGWFQPFLDAKAAALAHGGQPPRAAAGSGFWRSSNRDPLVIAAGDEVEKFILLSHGHDGSSGGAGRVHAGAGRLPEHVEHGARLGRLEAHPGQAHRGRAG